MGYIYVITNLINSKKYISKTDVADVTIDYYSTSGLAKSSSKANVPFKANRMTILTGSVFEVPNNYNYSIQLNSNWDAEYTIEW